VTKPDFEQFVDVIRRVFKQPDVTITRASKSTQVPGWNSLSHVMLILELQSEFDSDIEPGETLMLKDVGALYDMTVQKIP
jgi:hypothetical protein